MPIPDAELDALLAPMQAPVDPYAQPVDPYSDVTDLDLDALLSPPPPPPPEEAAAAPQPHQVPDFLQAPAQPEDPYAAPPPMMTPQEQTVSAAESGDKAAQEQLQAEAAANAPKQAPIQPPQLVGEPGGSTAVVTRAPEQYNVDGRAALSALPPEQLFAAIDAMDPDQRGEVIAGLSPDARAAWIAHDNARREDYANIRMEEEVRQAESQQAEMAAKSLELRSKADQMITQIMHDAETMQTEPIDSRSDFSKVMGSLGSAWGAVMALTYGGENETAKRVQQSIESDINRQRISINNNIRSLENRRGIVNKLYEQSGDIDQAVHTARILMYKQAQEKVAQEMHKYDPDNTRARAHAQSIMTLRSKEAEAAAAAREATSKRAEKAHAAWATNRKLELEERRVQVLENKNRGVGGGGGGGSRSQQPTPEGVIGIASKFYPNLKPEDLKPGSMNDKRIRDRMLRINGRDAFMDRGDDAGMAKTRQQLLDAMHFTSLTNELKQLVATHGWEPGSGRIQTEAGARMESIYHELVSIAKGDTQMALGVLTGPDLDIVKGWIGRPPSEINMGNETASLSKATESVVAKINRRLEAFGAQYEPGKWAKYTPVIPDKSLLKAPKVKDALTRAERMLEDYDGEDPSAINGAIVMVRKLLRPGSKRVTSGAERKRLNALLDSYEAKVPPEQRKKWLEYAAPKDRSEFTENVTEVVRDSMGEEFASTGPDLAAQMRKDFPAGKSAGDIAHERSEAEDVRREEHALGEEEIADRKKYRYYDVKNKALRKKYETKRKARYSNYVWLQYLKKRAKNAGARPPK